MALALLLSLLIHALVLSLTFGSERLGLPGFAFPWRDRRIEVPDLRMVFVPAHVTPAEPAVKSVAEPSQRASIEPSVVGGPVPTPPLSPALRPHERAVANEPPAKPTAQAQAKRNAVASAAPAKAPMRANGTDRAAPLQIPDAVTPSASSPETTTSASRDAGVVAQEAQRLEAARQEAARVEAARVEAERQEAEAVSVANATRYGLAAYFYTGTSTAASASRKPSNSASSVSTKESSPTKSLPSAASRNLASARKARTNMR